MENNIVKFLKANVKPGESVYFSTFNKKRQIPRKKGIK